VVIPVAAVVHVEAVFSLYSTTYPLAVLTGDQLNVAPLVVIFVVVRFEGGTLHPCVVVNTAVLSVLCSEVQIDCIVHS
jgi:hypothetical protein